MSPVIRVDDQVWEWLQSNARPFEDTPNSVLRRTAGIDPPVETGKPQSHEPLTEQGIKMSTATPRLGRRITGDALNRQHRLGARHALYHKDGMFYERLTEFPGVLCDPSGYVRYDNEQAFLSDRHLSIGQKVNIPASLGAHPRYKRFA